MEHDYPKTNMITGVTRTPFGNINIVETDRFEDRINYIYRNEQKNIYNHEMLDTFSSMENSFNETLAQHNADMDMGEMNKE